MSSFDTRSYDYIDLGDESDEEGAESSEDEIEIILHGTPEQKKRLQHEHRKKQQRRQHGLKKTPDDCHQSTHSSSEDDFEKEMNADLDKTVLMLEQARGPNQISEEKQTSASKSVMQNTNETVAASEDRKYYDDIYFDSDDEETGGNGTNKKQQHIRPSDDDLLYDPKMDDEDQLWVDTQRQKQHGCSGPVGTDSSKGRRKKNVIPSSDAVLDCPACMTTLCLDCQRHAFYRNQYRAMFVMNCKIDTSELLTVPEQRQKKKFKKSLANRQDGETSSGAGTASEVSEDQFHPVKCEECETVVGVVDKDEVYHFFNVLASQP